MESKKILMIVAPERFRDEEFFEPRTVFEQKGYQVTVGSTRLGKATGALGGEVDVDILIDDALADEYDAIVISGGGGSKVFLWDNSKLHALLNKAFESEKVVSAICISPVVLAKAGLLEGKAASIFPADDAIAEMKKAGADLKGKAVVKDGKIVTANGPECAAEFGETVVSAISDN
ncbi:DJ-1/PfpI family protein [Methanimicrococcus blatticola]|uniref:Protease I n=1 Tax=Methanimicrococcus blatticola TaxID=91560 RepID=A0A484F6J0_9EURY|nr:DJ-1/PfpI family protein [Methanimicrococcus blatticola]MBZ3934896.1 DJ-1/PfpI family protein [Methanimicrococcus blatticola]MCC2509005.1 DJ-1/PfpI family protein [Methanimicrococcus blatticola]TDQ70968.1 protease I [Methanimicrococcus blatticola]